MTSSAGSLKIRVLVADDERTIADTLRAILEQNGFDVATAYCGCTAVETARFWRPNVFLTDVLMPDLNGIEAAIRVCELLPGCRVLLLSGAGVTLDLLGTASERGYRFAFAPKPVHPSQLLHLLAELCRYQPGDSSQARIGSL